MSQPYTCPFHEERGPQNDACPDCVTMFEALPDPATMTGDERAAELQRWVDNILTVPFSTLHARIEAVVGRPVWTHEMGSAFPLLMEEARARTGAVDIAKVIDKLPSDKPVIVVAVPQ